MRVVLGALNKLGLSGRIPRPFVVVHSGNTQMMRFGWSRFIVARVVRVVVEGGCISGGYKARTMEWKRVVWCSSREFG